MAKIDIEILKKLNYEEGAELLTAAGYMEDCGATADAAGIAQFVSDCYWVLYNEEGDEIDTLSWVMYFNTTSDGESEIIREEWERVE